MWSTIGNPAVFEMRSRANEISMTAPIHKDDNIHLIHVSGQTMCKGLIYPFKSSVFRGMFARAGRISVWGSWVGTEAPAMGQALVTEFKAASAGECR
jgi:hypothetical protein